MFNITNFLILIDFHCNPVYKDPFEFDAFLKDVYVNVKHGNC